MRTAEVDSWRGQREGGDKWDERVTDQDRELYERTLNAASEAEREGDAQFQAAVAASRVVNQAVVSPTHLDVWTLKFESPRLEAAYARKTVTNSGDYDYVPVTFKLAFLIPHLFLCVLWCRSRTHLFRERTGPSSSQPELAFVEIWSIVAALAYLFVLGIQLWVPLWYRRNRGTTMKYLVVSLWVWETVKLLLNTNDMADILAEVFFVNVSMSVLHGMPFVTHFQLRSYGGAMQAMAITWKAVNLKLRLQALFLALVGHIGGLAIAYAIDWHARKEFLLSLPVWLLDDIRGHRSQAASYRASLSRQMWSIFYPELLDDPETSGKTVMNSEITPPRRALGGFAGGFGGVSSLKCIRPLSTISTISSSSSLSGDGSSDSSSGHWGGGGQTGSGISGGEDTAEFSGSFPRASVQWSMAGTTSACSQVGLEPSQSAYMRSRAPRTGRSISRGTY